MKGVPDAIHHTDTSETLEYITGWNDCRQAMMGQPEHHDPIGDAQAALIAEKAAQQEPIYHLRQFGDVTKEQLDRYMATGDINPQPAQRKPLNVAEVEQILAQHNYEIHGDRARYIVRMTEAAHGIKEST